MAAHPLAGSTILEEMVSEILRTVKLDQQNACTIMF